MPDGPRCSTVRISIIGVRSALPTGSWQTALLVADNGNGFMVSKNDYGDFDLRVEFWIEAKTNSGVFIRCTDPEQRDRQDRL